MLVFLSSIVHQYSFIFVFLIKSILVVISRKFFNFDGLGLLRGNA